MDLISIQDRSNKKRLFSSSRQSRSSLPPVPEEFPWDHPDLNYKLTEVNENNLPKNDLMVETGPTQTKNSHHLISHWTGSTQESLNQLALGLDRKRPAFLFYQTCVFVTHGFIKVEQKKPYGIILIPRGTKMCQVGSSINFMQGMRSGDKGTAPLNGKTIEWSWPGHLTKMEGFVDGSASFPEVDIATPLAGETKLSSAAANVDDNSDVVPFGEETKEEKKTAKYELMQWDGLITTKPGQGIRDEYLRKDDAYGWWDEASVQRGSEMISTKKTEGKPSQNVQTTEHGMEKTCANQGQSPKMPKVRVNTEESAVKPTAGGTEE
ncbi:sister chromatid cohesion 1 protein 1 [Tanacetum coccineum]